MTIPTELLFPTQNIKCGGFPWNPFSHQQGCQCRNIFILTIHSSGTARQEPHLSANPHEGGGTNIGLCLQGTESRSNFKLLGSCVNRWRRKGATVWLWSLCGELCSTDDSGNSRPVLARSTSLLAFACLWLFLFYWAIFLCLNYPSHAQSTQHSRMLCTN